MFNKTRATLRYIVENYPYPDDLSKTRITKLVYLSDWKMAQKQNRQMTEIDWYFDHYGPYVSDVLDEADEDKDLQVETTYSAFGTRKYVVRKKIGDNTLDYPNLSNYEKNTIDEVINDTKLLSWNNFIDYVYETYPVKVNNKYSKLDLAELASKGKN